MDAGSGGSRSGRLIGPEVIHLDKSGVLVQWAMGARVAHLRAIY
jgi:hypothetical protein